jgi:hypothetical protein
MCTPQFRKRVAARVMLRDCGEKRELSESPYLCAIMTHSTVVYVYRNYNKIEEESQRRSPSGTVLFFGKLFASSLSPHQPCERAVGRASVPGVTSAPAKQNPLRRTKAASDFLSLLRARLLLAVPPDTFLMARARAMADYDGSPPPPCTPFHSRYSRRCLLWGPIFQRGGCADNHRAAAVGLVDR